MFFCLLNLCILVRAVSQHPFCIFACLHFLQVPTMPTLKLILSKLYKKISTFISPYPDIVQTPSIQLYKTISSITRYSSHLKFLRFCLKHKIIPKGFTHSFHPSFEVSHSELFRSQINKVSLQYSLSLIRLHIQALQKQLAIFQCNKVSYKKQLFSSCHFFIAIDIISYIKN